MECAAVIIRAVLHSGIVCFDYAPGAYRVHLDSGSFEVSDQDYVDRCHVLREAILVRAMKNGLSSAALFPVLQELAASLVAKGMTRATFLRNAELWYDSVLLAATGAGAGDPDTNAAGGLA